MNDDTTGTHWIEVRRSTGLSREKFAQRVGITPGAVWRIEVRGVFKSGELEKLRAEFPDASTVKTSTTVGTVAPPAATSLPEASVIELLDLVDEPQWVDVGRVSNWTRPYEERVGVGWRDEVWGKRDAVLSPTTLSAVDGVPRYSQSELATFKDCRRRWWLAFYRGLRPRQESPVGARAIGDRVHRALERWYVPDDRPRVDPRDALESLIRADWARLVAAAEDEPVDWSTQEAFKRDADLQRAMVAGYVEWVAETGADSEYRVVAPEAYLEGELPELGGGMIIAKIDVRVLRTSDDVRLWLEHKTVGGFQQKLATIALDEQVLHQTLVETLQSGEEPRVVGVLYNMLRRTKRGATARPPFFQRVEVHHNRHEIESYRRRVVATIHDLRAVRERLDAGADHRDVAYPRPSGDCSWKCDFVQMCGMLDDGSRVDSALNAHFTVGDPYSYYVANTGDDDSEEGIE